MTTYTIRLPFDTLTVDADLTQAAAPIHTVGEDGELFGTPYQTADAGHSAQKMAHLVLDHLGPDYWADPSQETEGDDGETLYAGKSRHDYIDSIILSVS